MEIAKFIISQKTTKDELKNRMEEFKKILASGRDVAFVIRKETLSYDKKMVYKNNYTMEREEIIHQIASWEDTIVSTTGKASREVFETRVANGQEHKCDFLTVGFIAVLWFTSPNNLVHVVINNGSHETVCGMPTLVKNVDLVGIVKACGYPNAVCVDNFMDLDKGLKVANARNELSLIEVKCG